MADIFNMADTWNSGPTTFNSILMNVTNGAGGNPVAAAASQLINLQTNGTQRFGVRMPHFSNGTDATPFLFLQDRWDTSGNVEGIRFAVSNAASGAGANFMNFLAGASGTTSITSFPSIGGMSTSGIINSTGGTSTINQVQVAAGNALIWAGRNRLLSTADGIGIFSNNAQTDFTRLCLGVSTSLGPAIVKDTAGISFKRADDSIATWFKSPPVTIASLPTAASAGNGAKMYVTDANGPTFLATVASGGAVNTPVFSDGTQWRVG